MIGVIAYIMLVVALGGLMIYGIWSDYQSKRESAKLLAAYYRKVDALAEKEEPE